MKVLVLGGMAPFARGGAEALCGQLVRHLLAAGHEAEALRIPFQSGSPERLLDAAVAARGLRLINVDRLIALAVLAGIVPWNDKVVWLTPWCSPPLGPTDPGSGVTAQDAEDAHLRAAEGVALGEARRIFSASPAAADLLRRRHGLFCTPLPLPMDDPEPSAIGDAPPAMGPTWPAAVETLLS